MTIFKSIWSLKNWLESMISERLLKHDLPVHGSLNISGKGRLLQGIAREIRNFRQKNNPKDPSVLKILRRPIRSILFTTAVVFHCLYRFPAFFLPRETKTSTSEHSP